MSKQIDERVVSMQFDNKHFESNVKTTMSTLDKLKEKLNLSGSAKGFENISSAAKKVDMQGLGSAVDTVRSRFSALEVMGVTALANITNSAVNAGKRIVASLTIDPVSTGFSEYELKMNSIQTIMASTGESLETVNRYLDELNQYSDDTIYSFSDMTQNIGKFTNAGVKLEDTVAAIKGISNEAAISGANANEASRAMYNFAQALSAGYVKLIDWKSIENANMATVEFKNQLIATAVEMGTLKKASDGMYKTLSGDTMNATKNFNETLQDQWLTSEVLIETLKKYSDETTEIGEKATAAATEVKTFSMLMDTLKESAQSGWAQTMEIIVGDFEQAKNLFTDLSTVIGGWISKSAEKRNTLLEGAFGSKWDSFNKQIEAAGVTTEKFGETLKTVAEEEGHAVDELIEKHGSLTEAISAGALPTNLVTKTLKKLAGSEEEAAKSTEDMTDKLEYFQKVVNKVWHGDYSNGEARVKALTEAGYDYAAVQDLVNKTVDGHELTLDDLSDAQLKNIGYTEEQIKSIRELAEGAEKSGTPINELIESLNKPSGRELMLEALSNAWKAFAKVLVSAKQAWDEIFHPGQTEEEVLSERAAGIYKVVETLHKLSEALLFDGETAKLFVRTFKGIFAILDMISTLILGPIKIAFKFIATVLNELGLIPVLELTASIGDAIVKFRDWIKSLFKFDEAAKSVANAIKKIIQWFKGGNGISEDFIKGIVVGFKNGIKSLVESVKNIGITILETIKDVLGIHSPSVKGFKIGWDLIVGIINGILSAIWKLLKILRETFNKVFVVLGDALVYAENMFLPEIKAFISNIGDFLARSIPIIVRFVRGIGKSIADAIRKIDFRSIMEDIGKGLAEGIAFMFEIGKEAILGFAEGLREGYPEIFKVIDSFVEDAKKFFADRGIGFAEVMTAAMIGSVIIFLGKALKIATMVGEAFAGMGHLLNSVGDLIHEVRNVVKGFNKVLGGIALNLISKSLINFAIAIAILAGSIIALSFIDAEALKRSAVVVGTLLVVMSVLMITLTALSKSMVGAKTLEEIKEKANALYQIRTIFMSVGLALLAIAGAIYILGKLDNSEGQVTNSCIILGAFIAAIVGLMAATRLLSTVKITKTTRSEKAITDFASFLTKISVSLLIVAYAIKILSKLDNSEGQVTRGAIIAGVYITAIVGLMAATRLLANTKTTKTTKSEKVIKDFTKIITALAVSLTITAVAIKMLGNLNNEQITKGCSIAAGFIASMVGLMAATRLLATNKETKTGKTEKYMIKIGSMILGIATALLVMSFAIRMLGEMELGTLIQGCIVAGVFMIAVVGLMTATNSLSKNAIQTAGIKKIGVLMLSLSGALLMVAISMAVLGHLELSALGKGALVGMGLILAAGALMAATKLLTQNDASTKAIMRVGVMILAISAALLIMSGVIVILSKIEDPNAMWRAVGALGVMVACVALLMGISKLAENVKLGTLIGIVSIIAVLAIAIGVLSFIDPKRLNAPMLALGVLMLIAGALIGLSKLISGDKKTVGALLSLAGMIAILAGSLFLLSFADPEKLLANATVLAVTITVLIAVAMVLSELGKYAGKIALGALAISVLLLPLAGIAAILTLMKNMSLSQSMGKVLALTTMLLVLIGVGALLGLMGGWVGMIALGALAITLLLVPVAGIAAILTLMKNMPLSESMSKILALSTMLLVLVGVGVILGLIGALVVNIALGTLAITLLLIPLAGIAAILTLMKDMPLSESMSKILALSVALVALIGIAWLVSASGTVLIAAAVILLAVTAMLPAMGTNINQFITNIGTFGDAQLTTLMCAVNALKGMAEAFQTIVPDNMFAFFGAGQFYTFMENLPMMGLQMSSFIANIGTFGEAELTTATCAVNAIKSMSEAFENVVPDNMFAFFGNGKFYTFMESLPDLGLRISSFIANIGTFGEAELLTTTCAVDAVKKMAQAFDEVRPDGLFEFFGNGKFDKFVEKLPSFAEHLNEFMSKMKSSEESVNTVNAAVGAVKAFAKLNDVDVDGLDTKMSTFGTSMGKFADKLKTFITKINEVGSGSLTSAATNIDMLVTACRRMEGVNAETISNFGTALGSLGKADVESFITAVNDACEKVKEAGGKLIDNLADGAEGRNDSAMTKIKAVIDNAITAVKEKYDGFYNAGIYLVDGFALGISENSYRAAAKARAMAKAAAQAAEDELDINSPSKVLRDIGYSVPEGFALGIDKLSGVVSKSSSDMADEATMTVTNSVSKLADIISSDIDAQPTIRPILDLTDVRAGANDMENMFGFGTSVGLMANVRSVSSSMSRQNGVNDGMVSELKALRKDMAKLKSESVTINGVTYDDGSNVKDAVETIVRAARMERRT